MFEMDFIKFENNVRLSSSLFNRFNWLFCFGNVNTCCPNVPVNGKVVSENVLTYKTSI